MNPYQKFSSSDNKEVTFWEGSALNEDFTLFSQEDSQRIDLMREMIFEVLSQNPNLTPRNIAKRMEENTIDPKLIDAVLGNEYSTYPILTTKQKLFQFLLAQNPQLSQQIIIKCWNKIKR
jgi:hypothetical protein